MHQIKSNRANRKSRRLGRGGKRGKTSGRGTKGQNARAGRKKRPEMRDIIKKFPKLRGRGKNSLRSIKEKPIVFDLATLNSKFSSGDTVSPESLAQRGLLNGLNYRKIKILGGSEVTKKLIVSGCLVSESAKSAIEKAGGQIA